METNRITSARRSKSGRGSVCSRSCATYQQVAIDVGPSSERPSRTNPLPVLRPTDAGVPDVMWLQARFVAKNCCKQPQRARWSAGVDASVLVPNPFHREGKSTRSAGREADSCRTRTACDDQLHRLGGTDGEGRREKRLPSLKDSCPPSRFPTEMRNFNQCWAAASPLIFPLWRRADRFFQTLRRPPPRDRHASRSYRSGRAHRSTCICAPRP